MTTKVLPMRERIGYDLLDFYDVIARVDGIAAANRAAGYYLVRAAKDHPRAAADFDKRKLTAAHRVASVPLTSTNKAQSLPLGRIILGLEDLQEWMSPTEFAALCEPIQCKIDQAKDIGEGKCDD